ncbi:hypothetical protein DES40_2144 [Litorimonas taeanensis]|uniref:Polyketide cyclase/dehydrase/lipid transport protein n=1 Tax=Litorimonas taeanensis TaxID=568099 RepID=A0A420WE96_9PROT|nr:hypothetical protein [Litorimonas taeanensis]RKQ69344.1 hypothetical protein DES40_2144 [Litorimonas taeanensis]
MSKRFNPKFTSHPAGYVVWRLGLIFLCLLAVALGLYALSGVARGWSALASSLTVLIAIPYTIGAWGVFLIDPKGTKLRQGHTKLYITAPTLFMLAVLFLGSLILGEGVICMVMLSPIWLLSAIAGGLTVRSLHKKFINQSTFLCSSLMLMPILALIIDSTTPLSTDYRQVKRAIIIDAPTEAVWSYIHHIDNITAEEGRWNLSQDVIGLPRPDAARMVGHGIGAIRTSYWGESITFEEHITRSDFQKTLEWNFVFPNDSLQHHTDRHISPDGEVLKIQSGGYKLVALAENKVQLVLHTEYKMTTPLNGYSALWGELFLGDIQNNILQVIKSRSETLPHKN